jgi:hypothetical protein
MPSLSIIKLKRFSNIIIFIENFLSKRHGHIFDDIFYPFFKETKFS